MKKENRIAMTSVIIGIILSILMGRVMSSENGEVCNNYTYIPSCTIISESDTARLEDCTKEDTRYVFIKNLSTDKKNYKMFNLDNTTDIIVVEDNNEFEFGSYRLYTCLYREVEENGKIKKEYVSPEEATGKEKKILIALASIDDRFMTLLKEVKSQLKTPEEKTKIKSAIELMERVLNLMICQFYTNNYTGKYDKKPLKTYLERIGMKNATAYSLVSREVKFAEQNDLTKLFKYFKDQIESISSLVHKVALWNKLTKKEIRSIKDMKSIFIEETMTITSQIMNRKQSYTGKTKDDLLRDFLKDLKMLINMLVYNKVDYNTYIDTKMLQDEILEEKDKEVNNILIDVIIKCIQFPNVSILITIDDLYEQINNNENLSYIIEENENEITTEPNTEIEKEEKLKKKVKQAFKRIISSDNVKVNKNSSRIVESVKPWNRGLFTLLNGLLTKYRKFNGTSEELIEEITADNAQIASDILNKREKWYNNYKNISIIIQIVENEFAQIKSIIKNRVDTDEAPRKKTTKEDNEKIINILESISIETNFVTEKEQRVIKALKEISLEEEVLEDMSLGEEESRDIRTILSEIAKEYTKSKTYEITDKSIQMKKQEIIDLVLKKFPIITEDSDILEVKEHLTEIVESIVDILVDGTVDHTQYKGFNSVKKEIKKEEEYIRKQDLISMLDFVLDFIEKCTRLESDDNFSINDYDFSVIKSFMAQMKIIISTENEKAVKFSLPYSIVEIYRFVRLMWSLKNIYSNVDIIENYDELWLNATSFKYYRKSSSLQNIQNPACIKYKYVKGNIQIEKIIDATNENLQALMKARTAQDLNNLFYFDSIKLF